jgi:iron complex outermembrane receptor protein
MTRLICTTCTLATVFLTAVLPTPAAAQSTGVLVGTVTDGGSGTSLPGVNVILPALDRGTSTEPDGRFTIQDIPGGTYRLEARYVGYATATRDVTVTAGDTTHVELALASRALGLDAVEITASGASSRAADQLQKADIQEANPRDAGEVLRDMSGVGAVRRGPLGLDPVVRGLRERQVGVYVDGMRTFPAGPARMDSPLSHTGPSTMRSVEVVKGPYALTSGGGQMSAIRVETGGLWGGPRVLNGRVRAGYDSNYGAYKASANARGRSGDVAYRVDASYHQGTGDYEAGGGTDVPAQFLSREIRGKAGYKLGEGQRLTVGGGYQWQDDVSYPGRLLNAEFFRSGRGKVKYEYSSGGGLLRSVTAQSYGYQTLHTMNNEGKVTFESKGLPGPPLRVSVRSDVTTLGGRLSTKLAPSPTLRLKVGADGYRAYRDAERPFQVVMNGTPTDPPFEYSDQVWPGVSIADIGAYVQAIRAVGPAEVTATTRADAVWAGADEGQISDVYLDIAEPGAEALPSGALDQRELNLSGALMLSAPLSEAWSVSVGGGTAVRTAGALERYADRFPATKSQTSSEFIGNPRLEPERSWQADLEADARYDRLAFKTSVFARRLDNYITLETAPDAEPMLPLPIFADGPFRYANATATFYGGEASASVAPTPALTASASASYLWGKNQKTGQPALGISPLKGTVGLRYEPPQGRFFVEGTLRAAAEQERVARALGETPTDGYATFDLKGGVDVGAGVSIEGGASNLTNTDYVNHLNATDPYAGAPIPEPGRVLFLNVTCEF